MSALAACLCSLTFAQATFKYETTSDWQQGFNGQITVANGGSQSLTQWILDFDFDRSIDVIWNATIVSHTGNHYRLQSAGWNDEIPANGSISFGFGGSPGSVDHPPTNFQLASSAGATAPGTNPPGSNPTGPNPSPTPTPPPTQAGAVDLAIAQTSLWSDGFTGTLTVKNTGSVPISPWTLSFTFDPIIQSLWNGSFTQVGHDYQVVGAGPTASIAPGASVVIGFTAAGTLASTSASKCLFNGAACSIAVVLSIAPTPRPSTAGPILLATVDDPSPGAVIATQFTIGPTAASYKLSLAGQDTPQFSVATNNPSVVSASIDGNTLQIQGLQAGRAGLRITEKNTGWVRFVAVRVLESDGTVPGLPKYLSIGSVSEDIPDHLNFFQTFDSGNRGHRVDSRYIYLNGGPFQGWDTWTATPGDRAVSYIRNSRMLGMIPIFVYYNIADSGEGYLLDLAHVRDRAYMTAYFKNLKLTLDILKRESPDDPVVLILEPDFLGYLAQNANAPASAISAAASTAYDSGVLSADTDPQFPDTVAGLVQAINYTISKFAPQAIFGWEFNLWASPQGGWTTPVPVRGVMHKTDTGDFQAGRAAIASEASGIAAYYLAAGVATNGARFVSIDKYGLDATGFESSAAQNPANSVWFWNNDLWQNYLTFVGAIHQTTQLPVILWQLPVGHINSSQEANPYTGSGAFPDLANTFQQYEDSAPTFFFGDTFSAAGARLSYFSANAGNDAGLTVDGLNVTQNVTWKEHITAAANAGVVSILFGAGVGPSTTNVGNPPTDGFWWITKAQEYLANPAPLPKPLGH